MIEIIMLDQASELSIFQSAKVVLPEIVWLLYERE